MNYRQFLIAVLILSLTYSCKKPASRSFYYWKSVFRLSQSERKVFKELEIKNLYIRFFDIAPDESSGKPIPIAKISFADKIPMHSRVVPVVYIVNKTLLTANNESAIDLASKLLKQVESMASANKISFDELQVDCDWTDKTHSAYFGLLYNLKSQLNAKGRKLSATIRLHQIKYKNITGIPPVDRGMLMYYNMGKISADAVGNSVFNTKDAAKYINYLPNYPLELDLALPAFSWGIHIRKGRVIELLNTMNSSNFSSNKDFNALSADVYTANHSFLYHGCYFMKDDVVKVEEITPDQCLTAANQVRGSLSKQVGTIAIYHLDSLVISHFEKRDFERVFNRF